MKKKTKTQQLYDSIKIGDYIWAIVYPWDFKPLECKISKNESLKIERTQLLIKTKVNGKHHYFDKSIYLYTTEIPNLFVQNALHYLFKDRDTAEKRYKIVLKGKKSFLLKEIKEIEFLLESIKQ